MKVVVVELPSKAKTINKYLGPGYEVLASFGHIRDLPAKDGSVDPDNNFKMLWEVDPQSQKRVNDIAHALKKADTLILATDPDREGEAISWHVLEALNEKHALKGQTVERVVFNAITKQSVTEAMKHPRAIDERAGRRLSGAPGARLSGRLHALAGALAQAAGRALGRPRAIGGAAAGLRPRAGDREIRRQGILVDRRQAGDAARRKLRSAPGRRRRAENPAPRYRLRQAGRRSEASARSGRVYRCLGRGKARAAQSAAAVHHLDHAAGGQPQARLCARDRHAPGAASLRRRRDRRRDHRPHHLYAHRRHRHGAGSDRRYPRDDRQELRQGIRAGRAAHLSEQVEERARGARSGAPDRPPPHARPGREISSTAIRRVCTS